MFKQLSSIRIKQFYEAFIVLSFLFTSPLMAQDCKVLDPNLSGVYTGDCKNGKASGQGKSVGKYTYEGDRKDVNQRKMP